jgi:hypothetical protein
MPHASRYYDCLSGTYLNNVLDAFFFEDDIYATRDEKDNLVSVRVHLSTMRRVACHKWGTNHEAVHSWRRPGFPRNKTRLAVAFQPENGTG